MCPNRPEQKGQSGRRARVEPERVVTPRVQGRLRGTSADAYGIENLVTEASITRP